MVDVLQNIGDKIVAVILATTALMGSLFSAVQTVIIPREELASIYRTVASSTQEPVAITPIATPITPGLLPVVVLLPPKKATGMKAASAGGAAKARAPAATPPVVAAPPTAAAPTITAQWLLDNTKFSFKQKRDGTYNAVFTANTGGRNLTWGMEDVFIGESAAIPKFAFSFSCNPPPEMPPPDSSDRTTFFTVRTRYDCTIGFAAARGSDQKIRSKDLHFETGPGQLVVAPPSAMNAVLANDTNNGGFVFTNQDTKPVAVTKLTLNLSHTALGTLDRPLVLRILDPSSGVSLFDYHMENFAVDPATPYTYAAAGIEAPVHFTLKPASQKLLPIQILGVRRLSISGVNPTVAITLRALTIDASDVPLVLNGSQIRWSCVVAQVAYNPNATSGPYATGEACR